MKNSSNEIIFGARVNGNSTEFNVFAKSDFNITLAVYDDKYAPFRTVYHMRPRTDLKEPVDLGGSIFSVKIPENLDGKYYTYIVNGEYEVTDPYSLSASPNSRRSAVIDIDKLLNTQISNKFNSAQKYISCENPIIYEMHVRDFTDYLKDNRRGKFLGIPDKIDYLKSLDITHIHLMPIFDFITVDELNADDKVYNWGYDPELYNTPEGSYVIDIEDPKSRILELIQLINEMHANGIGVIMDVVYNHTYKSKDSNFNILFPDFYYRLNGTEFANGSGCGNEIKSENNIMSQFIINSLKYWQSLGIDGFRFDLMALMDMNTFLKAKSELEKVNPHTVLYGEPWMADFSPLELSMQINIGTQKGKDFAIFNPFFRDAIKGDNDGAEKGFVQGSGDIHEIFKGLSGSIINSPYFSGMTFNPSESINYFNSHDNLILADKLELSLDGTDISKITATKMAFALILLAQGTPFFHAGNEFGRSKKLNHNSYNAQMDVNAIDWSLAEKNSEILEYVKKLIHIRKSYPELNLKHNEEILKYLKLIQMTESTLIYKIDLGASSYLLITVNNTALNTEYKLSELDLTYSSITDLILDTEISNQSPDRLISRARSVEVFRVDK